MKCYLLMIDYCHLCMFVFTMVSVSRQVKCSCWMKGIHVQYGWWINHIHDIPSALGQRDILMNKLTIQMIIFWGVWRNNEKHRTTALKVCFSFWTISFLLWWTWALCFSSRGLTTDVHWNMLNVNVLLFLFIYFVVDDLWWISTTWGPVSCCCCDPNKTSVKRFCLFQCLYKLIYIVPPNVSWFFCHQDPWIIQRNVGRSHNVKVDFAWS